MRPSSRHAVRDCCRPASRCSKAPRGGLFVRRRLRDAAARCGRRSGESPRADLSSYYGPFELRTEGGELVPIGTPGPAWGSTKGVNRVSIDAPLAPSTSYALWGNGNKLLRFRTGTTVDDIAPGPVEIEQLSLETIDPAGDDGTCRTGTWETTSRLVLPPDAMTLGVRFTRDGRAQEFVVYAGELALQAFGAGTCMIHVDLEQDQLYDVEVWARDLAGNDGPIAKTTVELTGCGGCTSTSASTSSTALLALALIGMLRPRRGSRPR